MAWKEFPAIEARLAEALATFDWTSTTQIAGELVSQIRNHADPLPEPQCRSFLGKLRRKRRLNEMASVAEALIASGQRASHIQIQYCQALIDLGYLNLAEHLLKSMADDHEARGLLGRIYKQSYINAGSKRREDELGRSIDAYLRSYRDQPTVNLWHGINSVALIERARRDRVSLKGIPAAASIAREILGVLHKRKSLDTWDLATAMEAHVALVNHEAALKAALDYTESAGADAFEINSTLRQMTEVWGLTETKMPGSRLLPILRAALLSKQGGTVTVEAVEAKSDSSPQVRSALEKVFGTDRFVPLQSYQLGLERAKSVARIERLNGQGHGTGWLVRGEDFFPDQRGKLLIVTNHHVVSDPPYPNALRPKQAKVHFQILNLMLDIDEILWSSPPGDFDITIASLRQKPKNAKPLELADDPVEMGDPAPRLFLIGHPGGRNLEFSLDNSQLVGANAKLLHYRTPTEGGSSGSPVFEDQEWKVVALHHAGMNGMQRLDGKKGTYDANEGIRIQAIRKAASKRSKR